MTTYVTIYKLVGSVRSVLRGNHAKRLGKKGTSKKAKQRRFQFAKRDKSSCNNKPQRFELGIDRRAIQKLIDRVENRY
jgi:hypothetical protein